MTKYKYTVRGRFLIKGEVETEEPQHAAEAAKEPAAPKKETKEPATPAKEEKEPKEPQMKKYRCKLCGYIYDPAKGDSVGGVAAGTAFENLPADWTCPECGAAKSDFEPVEE